MIDILLTLILLPLAFVGVVFTACLLVGCIKGLVGLFDKNKRK